MKNKTLFIITSLNDGGAEKTLYLACSAKHNNITHVISLLGRGKYSQLLVKKNIKLKYFNFDDKYSWLKQFFELVNFIKKIQPKIVSCSLLHGNLVGGLAAKLANISIIQWNLHWTKLTIKNSKASTVILNRICAVLSWIIPNKIFVVGESCFKINKNIGYNNKIMEIRDNNIDVKKFKYSYKKAKIFRKQLKIKKGSFLIGSVGRFNKIKDYPNFLNALRIVNQKEKNFIAILVGTGLDNKNLHLVNQIKKLNLNDKVKLLGIQQDIPCIMSAIDLFVLPSKSEAFPNVLLEAMACGTPCISTDVGDAKRIIGKTGWVVPKENPKALGEAIKKAVAAKYKKNWRRKCKACRSMIVKKFSVFK